MEFKEIIKGFELFDEGNRVGHIDFHEVDGILKITHTEVFENYSGKGFARQLVLAAVDYAKKNNLKVKPLCSAAAHILKDSDFNNIIT
jgi:predicted GNAT family acetyltransferase